MSILLIEPTSSGIKYIEAAEKLKREIYVITKNKEDLKIPEKLKTKIKKIIEVDTTDLNKIEQEIKKVTEPEAILAGVEFAVPMAAELGRKTKKTHINKKTINLVRNKYEFRKHITTEGLSAINFFKIEKKSDIKIPNNFKFPAVFKPTDMAGSTSVKKINNKTELYVELEKHWKNLPVDLGYKSSGQVIVEEYIDGNEYSVEGIVRKSGEIIIFSITEKLLGCEPYFVEMGHIVGKKHEDCVGEKIRKYALEIVESLEINIGPFHLELRVTNKLEPVAIEIAARLPGDHIVSLIESAYGINLAEETLMEYPGVKSEKKPEKNGKIFSISFIKKGKSDTFKGITGIEKIKSEPGYISHQIYYENGDKLGENEDWSSRVGHVLFEGKDLKQVKNLIKRTQNEVKSND
ncbi:MAG: ATP-grasp domain-containing protein [Alcaligenes aquatilis]